LGGSSVLGIRSKGELTKPKKKLLKSPDRPMATLSQASGGRAAAIGAGANHSSFPTFFFPPPLETFPGWIDDIIQDEKEARPG
jgi:hypothetical protein